MPLVLNPERFKRRNQPLSYDKPIFDSSGFVETTVAGLGVICLPFITRQGP